MRSAANKVIRDLWVYYWIIRVAWRHVMGRWFYFRDVPDVFIRMVCMASIDRQINDDYLLKIVMAAKAERKLRYILRKKQESLEIQK